MELRAPLAALARDDTGWQAGQDGLAQAAQTWRADPVMAPVLADMARFGAGARLDQCPALDALFARGSAAAQRFVTTGIAAGIAALEAHPLGQLPLRHGLGRAAATLVLAASGRASLALSCYDEAAMRAMPAPRSARFAGQETWLQVVAGEGEADDHRLDPAESGAARAVLHSAGVRLRAGERFYRDERTAAWQVRAVHGRLVVLRLQRTIEDRGPAFEYALADGALLRRTAPDRRTSRMELAMAALGAMGRADAVPELVRVVEARAERAPPHPTPDDPALRWEALRQLLVIDARAGLAQLERLVEAPSDPLHAEAVSLRAALLGQWPQLAGRDGQGAAWRG
ncbi:hypothetical protein MTR62_20660 [Novosphingobium sp. 1949]|uniref:Uncharacterized protein n=1 Tax=Novosphingobium organovorum TaxID=2930092 RepID=A0ABT0BJD1_9SPHN|nr:hypothetical protein [Novosphingobium organovorum]MCJ2185078.1 hypothetical protein [Novosphingobium organovorum]